MYKKLPTMTYFLSNDALWSELRERAKTSKSVKAAVAFLGSGGADLLPLKKGDTLIVNLGLQTVRQGATSPKEIQRLMRRGVMVFTRSNLHAKFFICGKSLLVGSANVSKNSQNVLDEAAALTTEAVAVRRATDFFDKLCTEPVRPDYLKLCLKAYRPPRFLRVKKTSRTSGQKRIAEAKLWFLGGLTYECLSNDVEQRAEKIAEDIYKELKYPKKTFVDYIHFNYKQRSYENIRKGDWFVACTLDKKSKKRDVSCPQQALGHRNIPRTGGKRTYLLLYEAPKNGQETSLSRFRKKIRHTVPRLDKDNPPTMPIINHRVADFILGLWTPNGRFKS